jgi:predicted nucleic acid-binding protein
MIGVDTNVLVRLIVADHPEQFDRAVTLMRDNQIFIGLTVFLETEWVLRSAYKATPGEVASAFLGVAGLSNVTVESPGVLMEAISAHREGLDFADALHVAGAAEANLSAFATFDEDLRRRSGAIGRQVRIVGV